MDEDDGGGIEIINSLEKLIGTFEAFDIAKVYLGAQPGDFAILNPEYVDYFEEILKGLSSINSDFFYRKRLQQTEIGTPVLKEFHREEIKRTQEIIRKNKSDSNFDKTDKTLFFYYNSKALRTQSKASKYQFLLNRVIAIRDFTEVIDYAPQLTPTPELIEAHNLIGTLFNFPPCCIDNFPRTIGKPRIYLTQEHEIFTEFVPCKPDCDTAIKAAGLNKRVFEITSLDINPLIELEKNYFKGVLYFQAHGFSQTRRINEMVKESNLDLNEFGNEYNIICNTRKELSMVYKKIGALGIGNIRCNTVIEK